MKFFLWVLFLSLAGCYSADRASSEPPAQMANEREESKPGESGEIPTERMLIRTGTMTLYAESPQTVAASALKLVQTHRGTVISQESQSWNNDKRATLEIRVPSTDFDALMEGFRALGEVHVERISSEDVTEEFLDLSARLKNQRALEQRFLELLTQASTVQETVEVERELARVRGEIESAEGRSNFLKAQVAESKITLTIESTSKAQERTMFGEVSAAFGDAWDIIITVTGGIIRVAAGLLPVAIILSGLIFGLRWIMRRKRS